MYQEYTTPVSTTTLFQTLDRHIYDSQSMPLATPENCATLHDNHICIISRGGVHYDHSGFRKHGTHCR